MSPRYASCRLRSNMHWICVHGKGAPSTDSGVWATDSGVWGEVDAARAHLRHHGRGRSTAVRPYYYPKGWKSQDTDYWEAGPLRSSLQDKLQQLQPWCMLHPTTMLYKTVLARSEILDIASQGDGIKSDLGTCTIALSVRCLACREQRYDHLERGTQKGR